MIFFSALLLHSCCFAIDEGISPTSPSTIPVDSSIQELSVDLVERSLSQPTRSSSTSVTVSQSSNTDSEVVTSTIFKQEGDGSAVTTGRHVHLDYNCLCSFTMGFCYFSNHSKYT